MPLVSKLWPSFSDSFPSVLFSFHMFSFCYLEVQFLPQKHVHSEKARHEGHNQGAYADPEIREEHVDVDHVVGLHAVGLGHGQANLAREDCRRKFNRSLPLQGNPEASDAQVNLLPDGRRTKLSRIQGGPIFC